MRYRLSTLVIALFVGPPVLAVLVSFALTVDQWAPILRDIALPALAGAVIAALFLAAITALDRRGGRNWR